jgi:hypothetical protein
MVFVWLEWLEIEPQEQPYEGENFDVQDGV